MLDLMKAQALAVYNARSGRPHQIITNYTAPDGCYKKPSGNCLCGEHLVKDMHL